MEYTEGTGSSIFSGTVYERTKSVFEAKSVEDIPEEEEETMTKTDETKEKKFKLSQKTNDANNFINRFNTLHTNYLATAKMPVKTRIEHNLISTRTTMKTTRRANRSSILSTPSLDYNLERELNNNRKKDNKEPKG